jgi:hypothetical protein
MRATPGTRLAGLLALSGPHRQAHGSAPELKNSRWRAKRVRTSGWL